jgi:hypothetical protein
MEPLRNMRDVPRRRFRLLLFIATVCFSVFLQNPESLVRALERAGLMVIVVRGLKGHYDDFSDALDWEKKRR